MADTKFDICSRALVLAGANTITDFDGSSTEAIVAEQNYEPLVKACLSRRRWRFSAGQVELNLLGTAPSARWDYAFQLPGDLLSLHTVTREDLPVEYAVYGDQVFTNEDADLFADYSFRADEAKWRPFFRDAFENELASKFALAVARDRALADDLRKEARDELWPIARTLDSQEQTTTKLRANRLTGVR